MLAAAPTMSAAELSRIKGALTARLAPTPLVSGPPGGCPCGCALSEETSYGFDVITFAEHVLYMPLDPWQKWLVIHAGELLPDGRPRFKKILLIVARQNGKTTLLMVLMLYWMFVEQWPLIVGQHVSLSKAKGVWQQAQKLAKKIPELAADMGTIRNDNNDPHWETTFGSRYTIEAANENGGRGGALDRFVVDELRQQKTWLAYDAIKPTLNAKPFGQGWWITNQGDARSVVLLSLRKTGISNIENPEDSVDPGLALFEYSAPKGSDMMDPYAIAQANPNVGHRLSMLELLADARAARESGDAKQIAGFMTEIMCMYVPSLDNAVDPLGWEEGYRPGSLKDCRGRLAMVPEVSPDSQHASISIAAMMPDGKVRVDVVASWSGMNAPAELRRSLAGWVRKIRPRKLGWIPGGGAAALAAEMTSQKVGVPVEVEEIRGEVNAVCMGFAEMVRAGDVLHSSPHDGLLTKQVTGSAKLWKGDTWRFSRKGEGHCDTAYGVAGAAHLARSMPVSRGRPVLRLAGEQPEPEATD